MSAIFHLVRHGQASFGTDDYDRLSCIGHQQARALGEALKRQGVTPDLGIIGGQKRHRETYDGIMAGLGLDLEPMVLPGLNEFDFGGLLDARFAGREAPENLHTDRRTHFRLLRDVVLEWQEGDIANPPEAFDAFRDRVEDAIQTIEAQGAKTPLAVSSGGPIGFFTAMVMEAPASQMITLQLQIKNCALSKYILTRGRRWLHSLNETPFLDASNTDTFLTYS